VKYFLNSLKQLVTSGFQRLYSVIARWTKTHSTSLMLGTVADLFRSNPQLVAENALLRHKLIILRRQVKRPHCPKTDRVVLVLLARAIRKWKQVLIIVQPETLLRWHRKGIRLFWRHKSKATSTKPRIPPETVELSKKMTEQNRLWGAERMRGELLKLEIRGSKRSIQKDMREVRRERDRGQTWRTFSLNHAAEGGL
jgi:hypothetical protein